MSSETVSDQVLNCLIHDAEEMEHKNRLRALLELKSRRAQQAEPPVGCAEKAMEILNAINGTRYVELERPGSPAVQEGVRKVIAAKLAPLFTLLAECRESTRGMVDSIDVLLRTAKREIPDKMAIVTGPFMIEDKEGDEYEIAKSLLAKLDAALGKGDADGGREEGK